MFCIASANAQSYTATHIGIPDGGFSPRAINDNGQLAGSYALAEGAGEQPGLWQDGTLMPLPLLAGTDEGVAMALNNLGQVVGLCYGLQADGSYAYQACIWENGTVTPLPPLDGAVYTTAVAINDAGNVVGYANSPVGVSNDGTIVYRYDTVLWRGGSVAVLSAPTDGADTWPAAIDSTGRVAVNWVDSNGTWFPARWTPDVPNGSVGSMVSLEPLGGQAQDINDSGSISGSEQDFAAVWDGSTEIRLGTLDGDVSSYGYGINDDGTVVGSSIHYYDDGVNYYAVQTAFVWDAQNAMRDLNVLLDFASDPIPGSLIEALAINGPGQILTYTDQYQFVLLTPSPAPPILPAPTGLISSAGDHSVQLYWSAVSSASGYNVKRSTVSGGPYITLAAGVASNSYLDPSAVNGTRYYYVVSARDSSVESLDSNETTAKPLAAPTAPTRLTAKGLKKMAQLSWRQSTSPEITRNRIYRSAGGGAYSAIAEINATTSYVDYQVSSKATYSYAVTAVNSNGQESPYSNVVIAQVK